MDWFLYDWDLHHEGVKWNKEIVSIKTNILLTASTYI